MHVYAPEQKELHAGVAAAGGDPAFTARPPIFPKGEPFVFAPHRETQIVYSRPFRIEVPMTVARGHARRAGHAHRHASSTRPATIASATRRERSRSPGPLTFADADDPVLLLTSALALGFLHGLGADHLMAIAALSIGATRRSAGAAARARAWASRSGSPSATRCCWRSARAALIVLGWSLPLVVERGGEMLGGILLIAFGVIGLWSVAADRVYGHTPRPRPRAGAALPSARRPPRPPPAAIGALAPADHRRRGVRDQQPARADAAGAVRPAGRSGVAVDAAGPDRGVRGRDPAVDVALRRRLRAADVRVAPCNGSAAPPAS